MENNLIKALVAALATPTILQQDGRELAAVPDNFQIESLERFREAPDRTRAELTMNGLDSFCSYVNRFKEAAASTVFVTPNLKSLQEGMTLATAVIDFPQDYNDPRWGEHVVRMAARPSQAYAKLIALDGKLLPQSDFARALEDIARFSSSHPAAELLEVAQTISLTSKGDFKSYEDDFSGSTEFRFDLAVKANAGSQERRLIVPTHIGFHVPLIDGLEDVDVQVKFLYRVPAEPGGKVLLGIQIVDRPWLEEAAINRAANAIRDKTALDVFVGTFDNHN